MKKYLFFRKKYPKFIFEKYNWKVFKNGLEISFYFKILSDIELRPKVIIKNVKKAQIERAGDKVLNNLIFNLGLIEMLSYWKATCSPKIEILAGPLNKKQIKWWKDLILKGMGQFFYENKINFRNPNLIKIKSINKIHDYEKCLRVKNLNENEVLMPIGGGKDSIVTLEVLKKMKKNLVLFSLNPTETSKRIIEISGEKKSIFVKRKFDKKLFELNRKGFLNGHTPFTAYLSFLTILLAVLFDIKYIAFSNERSSEEGNIKYLGRWINHQYSKSFDFEKRFRDYSKKYLAKNIEYFSFLRPLYEIQIAKLFSNYPKYFNTFLSCNEAYKTYGGTKKPLKKWCGKCPKCLFIFASLYPFIGEKIIKIFGPARNASHSDAGGKNLFEDKNLLPLMLQLIGEKKFKPFECVGTKKESLIAFYLNLKKYRGQASVKLPFLLKYFEEKILPKYSNLERESKKLLNSWSNQNYLPPHLKSILRRTTKQ